jgi:predicted alpha/beta hydrolase
VRHRRHFGIRLARLINAAFGYSGHRLGFAGRQPRNIIADWSHEGLTGSYAIIDDGTDYNAALTTLSLPILMVSLSGDPLVPLPCVDFLAAKLRHAEISQVELSAQQLGMPAAYHFRWVRQSEAVLDQFERGVRGRRQFDRSNT